MNKEQFRALVKKYLDGEATEDEKQFLETYYEASNTGESIESILQKAEIDTLEKEIYQNITTAIADNNVKNIRAHKIQQLRKYAAIAASILVLLSVGLFFYLRSTIDKSMVTYAQAGNILKFELSDGTRIWLNSKSKLIYPSNFKNKKLREVYLEGEAYFEVAKDKKHPFLVHTQNLTTRVLGTKFNIEAYNNTKNIEVTLVEGKVMLTTSATNGHKYSRPDTLFLSPNQKAVFALNATDNINAGTIYNRDTQKLTPHATMQKNKNGLVPALSRISITDAADASAWRSGKLIFNNERLENVLASLNSKFNIHIKSAPELVNYPITASFDDQQIDEILLTITRQIKRSSGDARANAEYKKLGNDYYIE